MKKILLFVFICFPAIFSCGQLKQSQAIDSLFSDWDQPNTPGAALGIMQRGELIYAKGYGLANMEYDIPIGASSVFRIGSTSKQFTAACIILLVEQGKLSLDDTLHDIFPDFPEYAQRITIRHLLNHTSGIRDYLQIAYLKGFGDDDYYEDAAIMQWLINQSDLNFSPGEEYLYSNSGYWLLGQIVNKVSGMNMAEFARQEIFEPLGMTDTHFHNDHTRIVKNRASGYMPRGNGQYKISMTTLNMIGDGGIFTNIDDIRLWDKAFYNSTVLGEEFWNKMTERGVLNNGEVIPYASGLMIGEYKGLKTIRHGGAFVGYRAELLRFPEQGLSIAIFANRGDANPSLKANQVADVMLKDLLTESPDKIAEKPKTETPAKEYLPNQLVGNYEIQPGIILQLTLKNDSLHVLQTWNKQGYNIIKTKGNTYEIPGEKSLSFTFSDLKEDQAQTLSVLQGGTETKAKRKNEFDASGIDLIDYTGSYYSQELDVTYHIELENGVLMARIGNNPSTMACSISEIDQFTLGLGLLRFERTAGVISGFLLDSGRVKNLKFEKSK
ncbi:serine hydrolase domain-containing protein [Pararhodonellum marinum]|uniref:serine hydrolase domain-containing protein n=1 Tax=Pararhodonellum marinum TaxID=2755358 RepID=UPI00188DD566|nr:serine hydrolase domain-containing protein [Pararhodonellum marinum]